MNINDFFKYLAHEIEQAGRLEVEAQRILHGCCSKCGVKLPENHPSYRCLPDCASHLADRSEEQE